MRIGLRGLNEQRYNWSLIQNPACIRCGSNYEDVMHYVLDCQHYAVPRTKLLEEFSGLLQSLSINKKINPTPENEGYLRKSVETCMCPKMHWNKYISAQHQTASVSKLHIFTSFPFMKTYENRYYSYQSVISCWHANI